MSSRRTSLSRSADFAYLVDFGIAETKGETRLTMAGSQIGSFAYMAPERFADTEVTSSVDVYALTCVLYEALTGQIPFPADSQEQLILAHLSTPPPRPSVVNPRVPPSFDEVIARGMAKQADDRYGSAGAAGARCPAGPSSRLANVTPGGDDARRAALLPADHSRASVCPTDAAGLSRNGAAATRFGRPVRAMGAADR